MGNVTIKTVSFRLERIRDGAAQVNIRFSDADGRAYQIGSHKLTPGQSSTLTFGCDEPDKSIERYRIPEHQN